MFDLRHGECLKVLEDIPFNTFHACATDPPYEINFSGKGWDSSGISFRVETWRRIYKCLRPGAYLLAFGGTRTFHRIACAIEDAGFNIKDTLMWCYSQGFPHGRNIAYHSKDAEFKNKWTGWNIALKPCYEPIILAQKPISEANIESNVRKWGCGLLNIRETRIKLDKDDNTECKLKSNNSGRTIVRLQCSKMIGSTTDEWRYGRGSPNIIVSHANECTDKCVYWCPVEIIREQSKMMARTIYAAKSEYNEKNAGLVNRTNTHTTVKPVSLMQYLVTLITPRDGILIDPFMGSGSTGCAAVSRGIKFLGIELNKEYVDIADERIRWWILHPSVKENNKQIRSVNERMLGFDAS